MSTTTVLIILTAMAYMFCGLVLFLATAVGAVRKNTPLRLSIAVSLFVLSPLTILWAKVFLPLIGATIVGCIIASVGIYVKTLLGPLKERIIANINSPDKEE